MTNIMRDKVLNLASRQVGYKESPLGSNKTKYGVYFDTPKSKGGPYPWFNGKKNGQMWCAVWVCWLFCQNEILGPDKAKTFLGIPKPSENFAAACGWFWTYLSRRKWRVNKSEGEAGDIIFFNTKNEKGELVECGHVGIIYKTDKSRYYTIEGNKKNQVSKCSYYKTNAAIYGLMRPAWSEIEPKEEPVEQTPVKPEPVTPVYPKYKVHTVTGDWLALRIAPNTKGVLVSRMPQGSEVELISTVKGEKVYGSNEWAQVKYLKTSQCGYCIKSRLKKA